MTGLAFGALSAFFDKEMSAVFAPLPQELRIGAEETGRLRGQFIRYCKRFGASPCFHQSVHKISPSRHGPKIRIGLVDRLNVVDVAAL
jgi:hypothetical protein